MSIGKSDSSFGTGDAFGMLLIFFSSVCNALYYVYISKVGDVRAYGACMIPYDEGVHLRN